MSGRSTTKPKRRNPDDPSKASLAALPELDFARLRRVPNRYQGARFSNVRVIDADLARAFPDSEAVNRALRRALKRKNEPRGARTRAA